MKIFKKTKFYKETLIDLMIYEDKIAFQNMKLLNENLELKKKLGEVREQLTDLSLSVLTSRKVTDDEVIEGIIKSINEQL